MAKLTFLFKRVEKKYLLTREKYYRLMSLISDRLSPDEFGQSTVMNVYLDTPSFLLIRNSIEAKNYKEKLRIRSYGIPNESSRVFLELKKKYDGVVYKRRLSLSYKSVCDYVNDGIPPDDSQIMREIDWCMNYYQRPMPKVVLSYEREAFFWKEDKSVRLTFDRNVRYRSDRLELALGDQGKSILSDGMVLMEIKTGGAMPLWLSGALDVCEIYPTSFSKYGRAYLDGLSAEKANNVR